MLSLSQVINDAAPTVAEGGGTLIGGYIYLSESPIQDHELPG